MLTAQSTSTQAPPSPSGGVKVLSPPPPPPPKLPPLKKDNPPPEAKPAAPTSKAAAPARPTAATKPPAPAPTTSPATPRPSAPQAVAPPLAAPKLPDAPATFSDTISVGYVMIPFAVADRKGRAVSTLKARDVSLLVDARPVKADMFERVENAPISFTILLDGSGSMGLAGKMDGARLAVATLLGLRRKGDDFALYVFANHEVSEVVPFTKDTRKIVDAMQAVEPWGKTAFFDALAVMPDKTLLGENGAKTIILITDGLDNASTMSREELAKSLEGVTVPIYPLTIRFPVEKELPANDEQGLDLQLLQQIADASGGRLAVETEVEALKAAVVAIHGDLRSQYLIGFTPTGKGGVKYRRFSIRLAKSSWKVRARAGYSGTEPPYTQSTRKR